MGCAVVLVLVHERRGLCSFLVADCACFGDAQSQTTEVIKWNPVFKLVVADPREQDPHCNTSQASTRNVASLSS